MTKIHYISPSVLPSRSANSVHVMHQCNGFATLGAQVILYAKRSIADRLQLTSALHDAYGVDTENWHLNTFHSKSTRGDTLKIALQAVVKVLRVQKHEIVLSRNLYASAILAALNRPILFETHQLEIGNQKKLQKFVITRPWVRTVVISKSLVKCLEEHHNIRINNPLVLHDAAPDGITRIEPKNRRAELVKIIDEGTEILHWDAVCGYFGQLYAGRGIDIIEEMAAKLPSCLFLVFGGDKDEVASRRKSCPLNLRFLGHVPHPTARKVQACVDILLMPYQQSVSIGIAGHDTARWMSPMKMFEYLAAGVPIISSDLPVLREVLKDRENALLVPADDASAWGDAVNTLVNDLPLAEAIGKNAHQEYLSEYTWTRRAEALLKAARDLQ